MHQCTAVALLKPPGFLLALSAPGHRPEPGHVLCELGEDHEDGHGDHRDGDHGADHDAEHAAMLWDEGGRPGSAVWVRWSVERTRLDSLPWCPVRDARKEACELFAGHRSEHSWRVTDPTDEAITRALAARHPHLFPEYRDGGGTA
ncbi:hypothetical protein [Streptomyces sp. MMBL 11-1]|uniref:hypothetical protein n=1 Tax=Streptomyces sp. MMBL 11-1 TaxID=3026420 RepID=UPI00235FCA91|nr:hypothetical protein [Streptomyces sp. MMBL 11-1]